MFYICSFIERALEEGESELSLRVSSSAAALKLHPIQVTSPMQDALYDEGFLAHRMKDQVAAVNGEPNARSVFLTQWIGFRLTSDHGAMGAQFCHERQCSPGAVSGDEKRDVFEIVLCQWREAAG